METKNKKYGPIRLLVTVESMDNPTIPEMEEIGRRFKEWLSADGPSLLVVPKSITVQGGDLSDIRQLTIDYKAYNTILKSRTIYLKYE